MYSSIFFGNSSKPSVTCINGDKEETQALPDAILQSCYPTLAYHHRVPADATLTRSTYTE